MDQSPTNTDIAERCERKYGTDAKERRIITVESAYAQDPTLWRHDVVMLLADIRQHLVAVKSEGAAQQPEPPKGVFSRLRALVGGA